MTVAGGPRPGPPGTPLGALLDGRLKENGTLTAGDASAAHPRRQPHAAKSQRVRSVSATLGFLRACVTWVKQRLLCVEELGK